MIAPQELRLGNYFQESTSKEIIQVECITKDKVGFSGYFTRGWQAEPIELNEDWLLKFGFEKVDNYNFKLGDYSVLITKIEVRFIICNYMDIPPSVKLKYVHQIQNLIHSLCGEELKIKES